MGVSRIVLSGALWVTGCTSVVEAEAVDVDVGAIGIEPDGEVLEVARGEINGQTWQVVALIATDGTLCVAGLNAGVPSGATCGTPSTAPTGLLGGITQSPVGPEGHVLVYTLIGEDAAGARVLTATGVIDARVTRLSRLGVGEGAVAVLLLAGDQLSGIELLDQSGAVVQHFAVPVRPGPAVP